MPTSVPPPPVPVRRGPGSILLGLFILWELLYLLLASPLLAFLRVDRFVAGDSSAPPWVQAVGEADRIGQNWADLSGQKQDWSLFAPAFGKQSATLAVEMHFPDDSPAVVLPSALEPPDPEHYGRWPMLHHYLYYGDHDFALLAWFWNPAQSDKPPAQWHAAICQLLREEHPRLLNYLRVRRDTWRRRHPDRAGPSEVILKVVLQPSPPPGQLPDSPRPRHEISLLRWRPGIDRDRDTFELEAYDPASRRFVPLSRSAPS